MNSAALDKRVDLFIVVMRYPMSVIDHKDGSSRANLQVWKGGLPPLERQRRDWFTSAFKLQPHRSSLSVFPFRILFRSLLISR